MNDLPAESGTALRAFGAASLTKAEPITALCRFGFRGTGLEAGEPTKTVQALH
jgi:hypothetical protein